MRLTLFKKLFISLLILSTLLVFAMAWLVNHSFHSGLQGYLNNQEAQRLEILAERLEQYYSPERGWLILENNPVIWQRLLAQTFARPDKRGDDKGKRQHKRLNHLMRKVQLFATDGSAIIQSRNDIKSPDPDLLLVTVDIMVSGNKVGWLSTWQPQHISGPLVESFYDQQKQNFFWIAISIILSSFVLAWFLVRYLLKPLKQLAVGAKALQLGDYAKRIKVQGHDELTDLSIAFNELCDSLKLQKETREQWLADISHELRTPLSVLKSEIEALQDGIRLPEPKYINSLHEQVENLSVLVADLYQLSLSDTGLCIELTDQVDIQKLLETSCQHYQLRLQEKQMSLTLNKYKETLVLGDAKSLVQLFSNLLENSYRYTDNGGQLQINVQGIAQQVVIEFEDSSPGVPNSALDKLFERLYRVDKSRSRLSGGSGLGLSICQSIVAAHGGSITASQSSLGGVRVTVSLPRLEF
ncbi:MAG: HAMP domain-containing protein [Psychromonas sp.]|nr:HAMP domain-containing protein [Psychromonas sp.]